MAKVAAILQRTRRKAERRLRQAQGTRTVVFLHIGKNAGTQFGRIADVINANNAGVHIEKMGHGTRLIDLPATVDFVFSIRDPISRFRSGFYSRKRKGRPRMFTEWTAHERLAFETFEHANDLAEALFEDSEIGHAAFGAITSIQHCAMDQVSWFQQTGNFLTVRPPVTILRQEHFDEDIATFTRLLGVEGAVTVDDDPVKAHRNTYEAIPPLSEKARANLKAWYRQDMEFYRACEAWLAEQTPV